MVEIMHAIAERLSSLGFRAYLHQRTASVHPFVTVEGMLDNAINVHLTGDCVTIHHFQLFRTSEFDIIGELSLHSPGFFDDLVLCLKPYCGRTRAARYWWRFVAFLTIPVILSSLTRSWRRRRPH